MMNDLNNPRTEMQSAIRWVASFTFLDIFLCAFVFLNCLATPDLCGVGSVFVLGIMYPTPLDALFPNLGSWNGLPLGILLAPALWFLIHLALGLWFWMRHQKKLSSWTDTLSTAIALNVLILIVTTIIYWAAVLLAQ